MTTIFYLEERDPDGALRRRYDWRTDGQALPGGAVPELTLHDDGQRLTALGDLPSFDEEEELGAMMSILLDAAMAEIDPWVELDHQQVVGRAEEAEQAALDTIPREDIALWDPVHFRIKEVCTPTGKPVGYTVTRMGQVTGYTCNINHLRRALQVVVDVLDINTEESPMSVVCADGECVGVHNWQTKGFRYPFDENEEYIRTQWLYDAREYTGVISGEQLHELFVRLLGKPSPSGYEQIHKLTVLEDEHGRILVAAAHALYRGYSLDHLERDAQGYLEAAIAADIEDSYPVTKAERGRRAPGGRRYYDYVVERDRTDINVGPGRRVVYADTTVPGCNRSEMELVELDDAIMRKRFLLVCAWATGRDDQLFATREEGEDAFVREVGRDRLEVVVGPGRQALWQRYAQ